MMNLSYLKKLQSVRDPRGLFFFLIYSGSIGYLVLQLLTQTAVPAPQCLIGEAGRTWFCVSGRPVFSLAYQLNKLMKLNLRL